ncbi:quinolinate synthase NadA [bacterium]
MDQKIIEHISKLKKDRNAIILSHTYQLPEIQDIADYVGDSFGLSQTAANTKADVIVFCGVHFMAETASILCPEKTILLPEIDAGCPMANMITAKKLIKLKEKHPDATVVTYINSPAEVKAESDIICTSANAVTIVRNIKNRKIIFTPDKYLGSYAAEKNPDKEIILYNGYCIVHVRIIPEHILKLKKNHPNAAVLVHPECTPPVRELADVIASTTGIINFAKNSDKKEFIIGTEIGIMHQLEKNNPDKKFYHVSPVATCVNMKKITLEKIVCSLEDLKYKIEVNKETRQKSKHAIYKMFEYVRCN